MSELRPDNASPLKPGPEMDGLTSGLGKVNGISEVLPAQVSMSPNDGDNPSIGSGVAGPSGKDPRNHSGGNVSDCCPGMPGA